MVKNICYMILGGLCMTQAYATQWFWNQNIDFNPSVPQSTTKPTWANVEKNILWSVQKGINTLLSYLAFIAVIILIIAWFKMLLSAWDEKAYEAAQKIVKNVAIALILIWASRLIVSIVFWLVWVVTTPG